MRVGCGCGEDEEPRDEQTAECNEGVLVFVAHGPPEQKRLDDSKADPVLVENKRVGKGAGRVQQGK